MHFRGEGGGARSDLTGLFCLPSKRSLSICTSEPNPGFNFLFDVIQLGIRSLSTPYVKKELIHFQGGGRGG